MLEPAVGPLEEVAVEGRVGRHPCLESELEGPTGNLHQRGQHGADDGSRRVVGGVVVSGVAAGYGEGQFGDAGAGGGLGQLEESVQTSGDERQAFGR